MQNVPNKAVSYYNWGMFLWGLASLFQLVSAIQTSQIKLFVLCIELLALVVAHYIKKRNLYKQTSEKKMTNGFLQRNAKKIFVFLILSMSICTALLANTLHQYHLPYIMQYIVSAIILTGAINFIRSWKAFK